MPSEKPIPTVSDFLTAGKNALRGRFDKRADVRDGSVYDYIAGTAAMIWSQELQRDRDLFLSVYTDTADGQDLTDRVEAKYGITRILDTLGTGTAQLSRASAAAGEGTIWAGTRIIVSGSLTEPRVYAVASDTYVAATATAISVPIEATVAGPGSTISVSSGAFVDDPLWDTWSVGTLTCGAGTLFEDADTLRARARATLLDSRAGRAPAIIQACRDAGATKVVAFASDYSGDSSDYGISVVYVGDQSFVGTTSLVRACMVALEAHRACGCAMMVLPMTYGVLPVTMTVSLWDNPVNFDQPGLTSLIRDAVGKYFSSDANAFAYKLDAMGGCVFNVSPDIQSVSFSLPVSDATLSASSWPSVLTRYTVNPNTISVTLSGPN